MGKRNHRRRSAKRTRGATRGEVLSLRGISPEKTLDRIADLLDQGRVQEAPARLEPVGAKKPAGTGSASRPSSRRAGSISSNR